MPPARTEVKSIPDFLWSGIKLPVLALGLSFCHNLCCKCPNGLCKPILDIYTSTAFRWYKKLFNTRCFDLCNRSLKVQESTGTPTPKMGATWECESSFSHSSWPVPLQTFALVASPRLGLRHHLHIQVNNFKVNPYW